MNRPSTRFSQSEAEAKLTEAIELARRSRDTGCESLSDTELEALLHSAAETLADYPDTEQLACALGTVDTAVRRRLGIWNVATSEVSELGGAIAEVRRQAERAIEETRQGAISEDVETPDEEPVRVLAELLARLATEHPSEVRQQAEFYDLFRAADDSGCLWFAPTEQQLVAAALLLQGVIVEMDAGEGKTLASAMAAAIFAASGRKVHVLTANDYLAARDCDLLAPVLESIGLTVGLVIEGMDRQERKYQYAAQIVFTTAREVGFDYLRDSVAESFDRRVDPTFDVAIADEADHLLIDQARTPLIISGDRVSGGILGPDVEALASELVERQAEYIDDLYAGATSIGDELSEVLATILLAGGLTPRLVSELERIGLSTRRVFGEMSRLNDEYDENPLEKELLFVIDPAMSTIRLTERGWEEVFAEVDSPLNASGVLQALRARILHEAGGDYVLDQQGVTLVDRLDGRPMMSHRYMYGLHEALESKEGFDRLARADAKARTTVMALMSNYETIAGLTGTALEASDTFAREYRTSTVRVPPEVVSKRVDMSSEVFFEKDAHLTWVTEQIKYWRSLGRPVLVTTGSVRESSALSAALAERSIPHQLLNAENADREAEVVALGGAIGSVTVSTGMAGRGTDFVVDEWVNSSILNAAVCHARNRLEQGKSSIFECPSHQEAEALFQVLNELGDCEAEVTASLSDNEIAVRPPLTERQSEVRMPFSLGLMVLVTSLPESVRVERQIRGRTARQGAFGTSKLAVYINDPALAFSRRQSDLTKLNRTVRGTVEGPRVDSILSQVQMEAESQRESASRAMADFEAVVEGASRAHYKERVHMMDSIQSPTLTRRMVSDWVARRTKELDDLQTDYETRFAIVSDGLWHSYRMDIGTAATWTPTDVRRELELEVHERLAIHRDRLGSKRFCLAVAECRLNAADDHWPARLAQIGDMATTLAAGASSRHAALTELAEQIASTRSVFWGDVEDQAVRVLLSSAGIADRGRMGDNRIEQLPDELEALLGC